jgi:hypothetical protein
MIMVGILGEYVGRVYEEGKGRPLYIVADTWNLMSHEAGDDVPGRQTESEVRTMSASAGTT